MLTPPVVRVLECVIDGHLSTVALLHFTQGTFEVDTHGVGRVRRARTHDLPEVYEEIGVVLGESNSIMPGFGWSSRTARLL